MLDLWNYFYEYIQISYHRLIWVFLFACIICLLFHFFSKKRSKKDIVFRAMLSMACSFIFVMTLFGRKTGDYDFSFRPFGSYYLTLKEEKMELGLQIVMNIFMYTPLRFFFPCCFDKLKKCRYTLAISLVCAMATELIQGIFQIGFFEVDDVLNNFFGTAIGVLFYKIYEKWRRGKV